LYICYGYPNSYLTNKKSDAFSLEVEIQMETIKDLSSGCKTNILGIFLVVNRNVI